MRKYLQYFIIMFLLLSVSPYSAAKAQTKFSDVSDKQYAWAMDSINFMTNHGIINGYPDGTFKPQNPVTKAELSVMIYKLFDKYRPNTIPDKQLSKFVDVPENHWAYQAITELYDSSFTNEFSINESNALLFEPEHHLTRLETERLLSICFDGILNPQLEDSLLLDTLSKIKDVNTKVAMTQEEWVKMYKESQVILDGKIDYNHITKYILLNKYADINHKLTGGDFDYPVAQTIANFQHQGIITVDNNGMLHPTEALSRAQVVTILYRIHLLMSTQGVLSTYSSIPTDSSSPPTIDSKETQQTYTKQVDTLDGNGTITKDLKSTSEINTTVSTAGKKTMTITLQSKEKVDLYIKYNGQTGFIHQEELPISFPVTGINEVRITTQVRTPNVNRPADYTATLSVKLK